MGHKFVQQDWRITEQKLRDNLSASDRRILELQEQRIQTQDETTSLIAKLERTAPGPESRAIEEQIAQNFDYLRKFEVTGAELDKQYAAIKVEINQAAKQAEIAGDSPRGTPNNPDTQANPAPANPNPGNNTDVPPPPPTVPPTPVNPEQLAEISPGVPVRKSDPAVLAQLGNTTSAAAPEAPVDLFPEDPNAEKIAVNGTNRARETGNLDRYIPFPEVKDYRVRISLAPSANYLYLDPDIADQPENLLYPLIETNGVIYPYTPQISLQYSANYSAADLVHTNYKIYNYTGSAVDSVSITGTFTAQDVVEANYVLAVIHFFRSVTKMFYGQDQNRGVPPPLVYLTGHGQYGFDSHPMVITNFTLNYPTDVDYINAGPTYNVAAALNPYRPPNISNSSSRLRLRASNLQLGGVRTPPTFGVKTNTRSEITRVPTKIELQISASPIVTRDAISNIFSLKEYATGKLLRGSKNPRGGGIW